MSGAKILLIDDESSIINTLKQYLNSNGYQTITSNNGKKGIQLFHNKRPDVTILDLGLPDINGADVLKEIRQHSSSPVIVLSVQDSETEKVKLLDWGADDYVTKPFSHTELLARIRVAIRRSANISQETNLTWGPLEVNINTREVSINNAPVKLTQTQFDLLKTLLKYKGKIVTQTQLLNEIWGPYATDHSHYIRIYISKLRKVLGEQKEGEPLILTEQGVGYRLNTALNQPDTILQG